MRRHFAGRLTLFLALLFLAVPSWVFGQYEGGGSFRRRMGGYGRGMRGIFPPPNFNPQPQPAQPEPKPEEKKDDKSAQPKQDNALPPITRSPAVENMAALAEQKLSLDDKKLVRFNFSEAPWTFVLEELASVSSLNLDWQELPRDALNLRSNIKYTLAQARDIINEHLLARGYATIVDPATQTMTVVNLDKLNTALVPRVAPEDLDKLQPHDLAKVSFRLRTLLADKSVDEFKQMLSPKAKLTALKATNRLEAIDAAVNLKQLSALLDEEQGVNGSRLVEEFRLRHTRAADVLAQLQEFMGIKRDALGPPKNLQEAQAQMMQRMQQMQMQQQQQAQAGQKPGPGAERPPEIRLMANSRRNSILATAPPDQMAIIQETIFKIDVERDRAQLAEQRRSGYQTYQLATLDPEVVVAFLESIGDLDPQTKLEADKKNRAVIAFATERDHETIGALVKNLDRSDRSLKVIKLRRLDADLVAGTLRALLGEDDKSNSNNNNYGRRFGWFSSFGSSGNTEETPKTKFRVDADVANNKLIVFANKIELEQVEQCLAEMGEVPRREGSAETTRVLDVGGASEEQQLLQRLKQVWESRGNGANKLIIDMPAPKPPAHTQPAQPDAKPDDSDKDKQNPKPHAPPKRDAVGTNSAQADPAPRFRLAGLARASQSSPIILAQADEGSAGRGRVRRGASPTKDRAPDRGAANSVPGDPIYITQGADGKLIITSRDTRALDEIEELMARLSPPRKDYKVFHLKYASAFSMKLNLEDFFQNEKKDNKAEERFNRWWYGYDGADNKKDDTPRLSQRRPLRFIDDSTTNTLLVQGATSEQLRLIQELVDLYDKPEPESSRIARMFKAYHIDHAKASVVAEVIKEVYRDLLSANDKALESYNQTKNQGKSSQRGYISYDFGDHEEDGKLNQGKFKGALSVGVDDSSNTLIVSCPMSIMQSIDKMVEYLDKAALPVAQTVQVLKIDRSIDAGTLQKKLAEILKKPTATPAAEQPQNGQNKQQQNRNKNRQKQNQGQNQESNGSNE